MADPILLAGELTRSARPWTVECVDCIDSTNAELSRRFDKVETVPHLFLMSDEQSGGRGRMDRKWFSVPGRDITGSLIFPAPVEPVDVPKLSLCAGLALVKVLEKEHSVSSQVRWPNDVLTDNGKIAGILSSYFSKPRAVVVGIGINVNSRKDEVSLDKYGNRTTLFEEIGQQVSRETLIARWILEFERCWPLSDSKNIDKLKHMFDEVSYYRGRKLKILPGQGLVRDDVTETNGIIGTVAGIDNSGALQVHQSDGSTYSVSTDDLLIPMNQ